MVSFERITFSVLTCMSFFVILTSAVAQNNDSILNIADLSRGYTVAESESQRVEIIQGLDQLGDSGNRDALTLLGDIHSRLEGVAWDFDRALVYYRRAAALGSSLALVRLGDLYRDGNIGNAAPESPIPLYIKAAEAGNPSGKLRLGEAYVGGQGVPRDPTKGVTLLEEAAELGDHWALCKLGDLYARGGAVNIDGDRAVAYFRKAADAGNSYALLRLGEIYRDGVVAKADATTAVAYFQQAAEAGSDLARVRLGELYVKGVGVDQDVTEGLRLIAEAGNANSRQALQMLGDLYSRGEYVRADEHAALSAYIAAGESGNTDAFVRLGEIYRDGIITPRDAVKSIEYYQRAISLGSTRALVSLADNHLRKKYNRLSNPNEGVKLLLEAMKKGEPAAPLSLAQAHLWGWGVPQDARRAISILTEAADSGSVRAAKSLVSLYRDGAGTFIKKDIGRARAAINKYEALYGPADLERERIMLAAAAATSAVQYGEVARMLNGAPPSIQLDTIWALRSSNPNVFVYIAQERLGRMGLYDGPANGLLTSTTIRALSKLCSKSPAAERCHNGPLTSEAARLIALLIS